MADNSAAFDAAFDAASLELPSAEQLLLGGGGGGGGADNNVNNNTFPSNLNSNRDNSSVSVLLDPLSFPRDNGPPPANPPVNSGGFMFASPSPFQAGSLGEGGDGDDGLSALEECAALGGRLVTSGGEEHASQRERMTGTSSEEPRTPNNLANSAPSSMANLQHGGTRLYSSADEEPQSNNTNNDNNNNNGETTPHKIPTVPYGTINARSPCAFQPAAPYARTTGVWFPNRERLRCALQTAADNMLKHSCDDCDKRPWTEEEAQLRCALEENIYARGHEHNSTLDALTALVEWLNQNNLSREAVDVARTVALRL
ncbi:hypothetical protein RI054_07g38590 [Pseudoscourfieldia marina]